MAARRALRKLGARYAAQNPLSEVRPCAPYSVQGNSHSSSEQGASFAWARFASSDTYILSSDDDSQKRKKGDFSGYFRNAGSRNAMVFGNLRTISRGGFVGSGFANQSVRFCSSGDAAAAAPGHLDRLPEVIVDVAQDVVSSGSASAVSEIAKATADSYPWTAALQYVVNDVHNVTGLPWWGSIVITTILCRTLVLPLVIYQVKSTARFTLLRPELEKIKADMQLNMNDPAKLAENRKKTAELFAKYKTDPFTLLIGALLQGPIFMCFFFGLRTMAEKMDSFKQGGALWFTDLSTPDDLYIFPLLTSITFLITVEMNAAEGMQGQPSQKYIKNMLRGIGVLVCPLTAAFPKALFCYWVTSNLWSMLQGLLLRRRWVKALLDIPETSHLSQAPPPPVLSLKPPPRKNANLEPKKARRFAQ